MIFERVNNGEPSVGDWILLDYEIAKFFIGWDCVEDEEYALKNFGKIVRIEDSGLIQINVNSPNTKIPIKSYVVQYDREDENGDLFELNLDVVNPYRDGYIKDIKEFLRYWGRDKKEIERAMKADQFDL